MLTKSKNQLSSIYNSLLILWNESKAISIICGFAVILRVALPYITILLPKIVLDQILLGNGIKQFIIVVGSMVIILITVNYLKAYTDGIVDSTVGIAVQNRFLLKQLDKWMSMDYENMESPQYREIQNKADKAMYSNHSPAANVPRMTVELLSNSIGFMLYVGVIAFIHPLILVVIAITSSINWLMLLRIRKYMEMTRNERSMFGKMLTALYNTLRDPNGAKDIRIYNAFDWLSRLYTVQYDIFQKNERKVLTKTLHSHLTDALMILLRDGIAYALLIWLVLQDRLSLGDFVFVFAAVGALAGWILGILSSVGDISKACIEFNDAKTALDYPDRMNNGVGIIIPPDSILSPSIELRNVSYSYPETDKPTLYDINLFINPGERLALVGANGAGKTTLVKLLCGLYIPSGGEILLDGQRVDLYKRDEYYSIFSTVFQDIHLLATGIEENVSQHPIDKTDREKVLRCLETAGLTDKVSSLPEGVDTLLVRAVNPDGTELSGGEKQKLAMARALYKNAPVLILDEPTSALDPIAESEVYQKYAQLTNDKTSIFISHRLASTRFCDRIVLLDSGKITEEGTHDELMEIGGEYAKMFNIQASYYQDVEVTPNE